MTTRVHIRSPFGNHLGVRIEQFNPGVPAAERAVVAELRHGEHHDGYVHSGSTYVVSEMPLLAAPEVPRTLTMAERLAGVSFNPSGDARVSEAKAGYAERFAEVMALPHGVTDAEKTLMLTTAMQHLMVAQMLVVKAITWQK